MDPDTINPKEISHGTAPGEGCGGQERRAGAEAGICHLRVCDNPESSLSPSIGGVPMSPPWLSLLLLGAQPCKVTPKPPPRAGSDTALKIEINRFCSFHPYFFRIFDPCPSFQASSPLPCPPGKLQDSAKGIP